MAPPQSYLDFFDNTSFSRFVNETGKVRSWHADFSYFGSNVYAYLLHQFGDYIDLVSIQFYESYSRAAEDILGPKALPAGEYLREYVLRLHRNGESFPVNFSTDADLHLADSNISLPVSKLILGFGNGWVDAVKNVYISPSDIQWAWSSIKADNANAIPRGLMFWSIDDEGKASLYLAKALSDILLYPVLDTSVFESS